MNPEQRNRWTSEVLDEVFLAFADSVELAGCLIFKGARVLARRLPGAARQSFDIDSNLSAAFVVAHPDRDAQQRYLDENITRALRRHFNRSEPVRFVLERVVVKKRPRRPHAWGWDAFEVSLTVKDRLRPTTLGLPAPTIDIAAPERLLDGSIEPLLVGTTEVNAYSLVRQTGEKLRAFLSSLPTYRLKVQKAGSVVRAKDLYDLTKIAREYPVGDHVPFWIAVGEEFRTACESRYVDCEGLSTFREDWPVTLSTFQTSGIIGPDVPIEEVEELLQRLVAFFTDRGVLPFSFPLPRTEDDVG